MAILSTSCEPNRAQESRNDVMGIAGAAHDEFAVATTLIAMAGNLSSSFATMS